MNCEIKPRIVRMIKDSIVGNATSYVIYKDKVFIPFNAFNKDANIQTLEQSRSTARRIVKKIHEEFEAEKFGNSVSMDSTYKDGTMIYIHPTNKLIQVLELKDKLEIERRQRESLYNNVVLKERNMGINEFGDSDTSLLSLSNIVHTSEKINNPYFKDVPQKSSVSLLVQIAKSNHYLNKLAQQLLPYAKHNNISISLVDEFTDRGLNKIREDNRKVSGVYYPNSKSYKHVKNTIEISKDWENRDGFVEVLLHEIIHSLSNYIISTNIEVKEDFQKYYEHALKVITKEERKNDKLDYALTNLDEFIAGIFTNPMLMHKLMKLPAPQLFENKYKNMFHEIIEYILRLFKINSRDTFYEEAFAVATNILEYQKDYYNNQEYETEDRLLSVDNNWRYGDVVDNEFKYTLSSINILQSDKAKTIFEKGKKNNWTLDKILTELQVPKEQKQIILDKNITDREEIITSLLADNSYTVEINTAKEKTEIINVNSEVDELITQGYTYQEALDELAGTTSSGVFENKPTSYYSNLTVPGGTNYTENEISTPLITPSIKGHAQFSTSNGIGWFRSDDKIEFLDKEDLIRKGIIKQVPCG